MRASKRVNYRINMGPYESVEISGYCEIDTEASKDDLANVDIVEPAINEEHMKRLADLLDSNVQQILEPDLAEAANYTKTEDSFAIEYYQDRQESTK